MNDVKIAMCQLEIYTGDITANVEKHKEYILKHKDSDFIVFPEMSISGYNCGDLFEKSTFIKSCENAVYDLCDFTKKNNILHPVIIVGSPRYSSNTLRNSAFIIQDGQVIYTYDKQLLANDYHHEDRKYFTAGNETKVFYLNGIKFGIMICEDGWKSYGRDIAYEYHEMNVDLIFSINYSYFTYSKLEERERVYHNDRVPMVYVNAVGVGDISKNFILYDGNSFIRNLNDYYTYPFLEEYNEESVEVNFNKIARKLTYSGNVIVHGDNKYGRLFRAITYGIREIYKECRINAAQVHLSGGVDSAIVAVLAVAAMGKDKCVFITQPSKNNGSETIGNAKYIASKLGVPLRFDPIIKYIETYKEANPEASKAQIASFEATIRKSLGISYTHNYKSGILSCGNHTENALGWNSFGDIGNYCGILQPIGDLTKTEVLKLCEYINSRYSDEIIPKKLYDGSMKPSAELEDSSEDPFDYKLMSYICEKMVRYGWSADEIYKGLMYDRHFIDYSYKTFIENINDAFRRFRISSYKRSQGSPVLILNARSFGFSSRDTIINHYIEAIS